MQTTSRFFIFFIIGLGILLGLPALVQVEPAQTPNTALAAPQEQAPREELDRTTIAHALKDISQIFDQFGLGAAAIKGIRQ
ncbi:MAG TPA: hypothetical protein VKC60_06390 [Opitutaceae bacterium]|nr:hypothetical protein [Opitutaceae bacterium]